MVNSNDVVMYVGDSLRALREGTLIVRSRKIINFGRVALKNSDPSLCHIMGLCLTSCVSAEPHEINISLKLNNNDFGSEIMYGKCSCAANSSKCKHIVGLLFGLTTLTCSELNELPLLGCIDLKQSLGKYAQKPLDELKGAPVLDFSCCVNLLPRNFDIPDEILDDNLKKSITSKLIENFSDSIVAYMYKDGLLPPTPSTSQSETNSYSKLLNFDEIFLNGVQYEFLSEIECFMLESSGTQTEINFYNDVVKININCARQVFEETRGQNKLWKKHHQIRITGTSAHPLFTYLQHRIKVPHNGIKNYLISFSQHSLGILLQNLEISIVMVAFS